MGNETVERTGTGGRISWEILALLAWLVVTVGGAVVSLLALIAYLQP